MLKTPEPLRCNLHNKERRDSMSFPARKTQLAWIAYEPFAVNRAIHADKPRLRAFGGISAAIQDFAHFDIVCMGVGRIFFRGPVVNLSKDSQTDFSRGGKSCEIYVTRSKRPILLKI